MLLSRLPGGAGWLVVPLLLLLGFTALSSTPVMLAMVQDHAGGHPATANGLYMGISFVIGAVIPMLVGGLADLVGLRFNTIGVSDGISMGTEGMKYSLVSREVIADSIETAVNAQSMDGVLTIGGCDKNMPGAMIATSSGQVNGACRVM